MFLLIALSVVASDEAAIKSYIDACERRRPELIVSTKDEIKSRQFRLSRENRGQITGTNTTDQSTGRITFYSAELKKQRIDETKQSLELLKSNLKSLEASSPDCVSICSHGFQVSSLKVGGIFHERKSAARVSQVVDSDNVILAFGDVTIWLTNADTSRITDGALIKIPDFFHVVGTQSYETVLGGSKTVFKIKEIDESLLKSAWLQRHPAKPAAGSRK